MVRYGGLQRRLATPLFAASGMLSPQSTTEPRQNYRPSAPTGRMDASRSSGSTELSPLVASPHSTTLPQSPTLLGVCGLSRVSGLAD